MKYLTSAEIRNMWMEFWKEKGHEIIASAPLVPQNDPTLLWINAGVAPLKKFFDGRETPNNNRMANVQKSLRTNDIDNVGKTARHHTLFEMLGNFSIGDYFRKEALTWGLELLTSPKWFDFDIDKLYFTIYPTDEESFELWKELGIKEDHIVRLEYNFWEIGEGPCGPNTEIFYDRGEKYDPNRLGISLLEEDLPNERYIEVWNIVFSQYNAKEGLTRDQYPELPKKNIDTGMGLERMACVLQEVDTNYDTDLFKQIHDQITEITTVPYQGQMAFKVIADHVRCVSFALGDGASFSNEGRGYVLRRILRRAVRFARKLGVTGPILFKLVQSVVDTMGSFYTELAKKQATIEQMIFQEEEKFWQTLENGEKKLLEYIKNNTTGRIDGSMAFLLYDTFGYPLELTVEVAEEYNFLVDETGFHQHLERQRNQSRSARNEESSLGNQNEDLLSFQETSKFIGYETLMSDAKVIGIFQDGNSVSSASGQVLLVFDQTPFYATSGGQIGDIGYIMYNKKKAFVSTTIKLPNNQHASSVFLEETIALKEEVSLEVDEKFRNDVMKNHSATHLMNAALRKVFGEHVVQQGSSLNNKTLRFDFNHFSTPTSEELLRIEEIVNRQIQEQKKVSIKEMSLTKAKELDVQAVFGEKYGDVVRVIDMEFSKELCGGTHVDNTGDIERFAILSCESKGSGIYRIEGSTSSNILKALEDSLQPITQEIENVLGKKDAILTEAKKHNIALSFDFDSTVKVVPSYQTVILTHQTLTALQEAVKELDKEFAKKVKEQSVLPLELFESQGEVLGSTRVYIASIENASQDALKDLLDRMSDKYASCVVLVSNLFQDKVTFIAKSNVKQVHAGKLVKEVAMLTGGNGGGRPDFAQAGGRDLDKVESAMKFARKWIGENL